MSDIEEDIKKLKVRFLNINWIYGNTLGITRSQYEEIKGLINNILSEREADKKRIKELEEENSDLKIKNNSRIIGSYAEVRLEEILKEDYIPVQKVKDKIEELKKDYEDSKDENGETEYYYPDYTIRKLEELLEDK